MFHAMPCSHKLINLKKTRQYLNFREYTMIIEFYLSFLSPGSVPGWLRVSCGLVPGRFRVKSHQFFFLYIFKVSRFSLTESDVCLVIGFWCKLTCYSRNIELKLFIRRKSLSCTCNICTALEKSRYG